MSDICFIVASQNQHWVLDRIAKEIGSRMEGVVEYCYDLKNIPESKSYFVTHYSLLPRVFLKVNPIKTKVFCFFTHESVPVSSMVEHLNSCVAVICESPKEQKYLEFYGVKAEIIHVVVECANSDMFKPHSRTGSGSILLSGACYARKSPEMVLSIMKALQERKFILIGKDWKYEFPGNVTYYDRIDYEKYPEIYKQCDVFLSCSTLEGGGPGGLIEAMHSNLIPVVSDTGNAREYIVDNYNGLIFPIDEPTEVICDLINKAYTMRPEESIPFNDVWQTVRHFNWDSYALNMKEIITDDYSKTISQGTYVGDEIDGDITCE